MSPGGLLDRQRPSRCTAMSRHSCRYIDRNLLCRNETLCPREFPVINIKFPFLVTVAFAMSFAPSVVRADEEPLDGIERLAATDPKPFVLVEARGEGSVIRGQGVVITAQGHVLSAGHASWDGKNGRFTDKFRISFRGTGKELPEGAVHAHKTVFSDREDEVFFEHYYSARLQKQSGSRFIGQGDLALFHINANGTFPKIDFYSRKKPKVRLGDVFHLCHFSFPHKAAEPTFLINPVEIVGVAQTTSGIQYLAKGYYRVGSSGAALLKNGRLIGIQSAAYTVNAKDIGEIPMGLISFQLVWGDLVESHLPRPTSNSAK